MKNKNIIGIDISDFSIEAVILGKRKGNFEILPVPYLRLFIRAYAIEIGGDSDRSLEQLDSFIGHATPKIKTSKKLDEKPEKNETKSCY